MSKRVTNVNCQSIDDMGRGIVHIDDLTVFVDNLLPTENADVETTCRYSKLTQAKVVKRYNDSVDRIKPMCKYFLNCGGCQLLHLDYQKQLEYKTQKVKNAFHKFAHLDFEVLDTIGLDSPCRYRNKVAKPIGLKNGKVILGFYRNNTHDLTEVNDCLMESELSASVCLQITYLLNKYKIKTYNEGDNSGSLRHLLIKTTKDLKQALVVFISKDEKVDHINDIACELMKKNPQIKGVILNINNKKTNVILGDRDILIKGTDRIIDTILDNKFYISAHSFFQVNMKMVDTLYSTAIDFASLNKDDVVLDAYCGSGTIGLSLAKKVKKVIGVEIEKQSIENAKLNAKINNIDNAIFYNEDCNQYMKTTKEKFDVIILDPPRKGAGVEFIKSTLNLEPKTIIYISCNPLTLARDVQLLSEKYKVNKIQPIDMFPNTYHVETVVLLSRVEK